MIDYHTHTYRCGHAAGVLDEYVERAVALGLREIGLSDHLFQYFLPPEQRNAEWAMPEGDFSTHHSEMHALRARMLKRIAVRVAVEIDYMPGLEADLRGALAPFEFDYVLGGVHFLGEWMIDNVAESHRYQAETIHEVYTKYYSAMLEGVRTRSFDVIAHFDLPKKFGFPAPPETKAIVARTLDAIRDQGLAIEVSTAGLRKPIGELYPSVAILRQIRRRHIPIVLASDAHDPSEVGYEFDQTIALLKDLDFLHLATYEDRRLRPISLG